jgi:formylglycine-generating enzyme required for sulfatase activity
MTRARWSPLAAAAVLVWMSAGCYRHARPDTPAPRRVRAPMVGIPAGTFMMGDQNGDPSDYPERRISVSAFAIDRFEVTNEDYDACVDANVCDATAYAADEVLGADRHPVVGVSWFDAERFCAWVDKRLPTEAEWEYAARGDDLRKWPWPGEFDPGKANTRDGDPFEQTAPVGSFDAGRSPFGVHDLAGNAAEWVADVFDPTYYRTSTTKKDPTGPPSGRERVIRGGSYVDPAHAVRVSARNGQTATETDNTVGFRCAAGSDGGVGP